ncbi:uncharacterized protein METZ01_LOCUS452186, partial [marine metagenome]
AIMVVVSIFHTASVFATATQWVK